jgi:hypothetical protein
MLSECVRPPNAATRHVKATAYLPDGHRAVLDLICAGRSAAELIVDSLYPHAVRVSIIQNRGALTC